jgi:hypothetical protein
LSSGGLFLVKGVQPLVNASKFHKNVLRVKPEIVGSSRLPLRLDCAWFQGAFSTGAWIAVVRVAGENYRQKTTPFSLLING